MPWTQEQKEEFLRSQFERQHRHYQEHYPTCQFLVIEQQTETGAEAIGRLYVDRWETEIRVVDIALVPDHRRRGLGTALLRGILAEAEALGLPVTVHVEGQNPAHGLYQRLGFTHVESHGIYHLMRWSP